MLPENLVETRRIVDDLRRRKERVMDLSTGAVLLPPSPESTTVIAETHQQRFEYTSSIGTHEERSVLAKSIRDVFDLPVETDNVAICSGATEGVFLAVASGTENWTAVTPGWHTFPHMMGILGRPLRSVAVSHLAATARVAKSNEAVFIQTPINPTGQFLPGEQLVATLTESPAQFLFDLTYLGISPSSKYDLSKPQLKMLARDWRRTTFVYSLSKLFRVPGLRLGFIVASAEKIQKISQCKAAISLNFPTNMQHLAGRLWPSYSREQATVQRFLQERDEWFHEACKQHGIFPTHRQGTHFRVFDLGDRYAPVQYALLEAGVVCAPTREMGVLNGVRVNLSADHGDLEKFLTIASAHR